MMNVCESNIEKISKTFNDVSEASFYEKREHISSQQIIDVFLDKILELKEKLNQKSEKIDKIVLRLEEITWYNNLDEACLKIVNEVISLSKDLHSSLIRYYVDLNYFIKKNIAKEEIKKLKTTIDDLKEVVQDLESTFFHLSKNTEFIETTKQLSLI